MVDKHRVYTKFQAFAQVVGNNVTTTELPVEDVTLEIAPNITSSEYNLISLK